MAENLELPQILHPSETKVNRENWKNSFHWTTSRSYSSLYNKFVKHGLWCLDNDGTISGRNGEEVIEKMIVYYENKDKKDYEVLQELLIDYRFVFRNIEGSGNYPLNRFIDEKSRKEPLSPNQNNQERRRSLLWIFYACKSQG